MRELKALLGIVVFILVTFALFLSVMHFFK